MTPLNRGQLSCASCSNLYSTSVSFLQALNGAGLTSVATSIGYRLDTTPPNPGTVYDGPQPDSGDILDQDYTTTTTTLSAHWRGFSDPHTGVVEYYWAIGTCRGCSDIQTYQTIGVAVGKGINVISELHFTPIL